ncbi:hypothetical protein [Streptomyces sp. HUCO-GS316]|nr:hypothetical protein [Streptomyces sp. HUCO-GS316]
MKHNPRKCRQCGTLRNGPVRMQVRKGLVRQTRTNGENGGGK